MDEILASIRRIIESGDERVAPPRNEAATSHAVETRAAASAEPEAEDLASPAAPTSVHYLQPAETAAESPSVASQTADHAAAPEAGAEIPPSTSGNWDDLRPSVADFDPPPVAAIAWASEEASPLEAQGLRTAENQNMSDLRAAEGAAIEGATAPTDFSFEFDDAAFEAELRGDSLGAGRLNSTADADPSPSEIAMPSLRPSVPIEMPESVIEGASALLSAQAGDQVAAAFDDLAHAIREGHMRNLEGMARDIMRPMLQEWLEDNLPRIVERLVREEIERIARGPRR
ncbi:hypothetical protein GCM10011390_02140 [Aureimonas endophytica]|uniref:Cell pole-organizing protein PopZ n=2 Tax=Aureimonas endophytica TaxID=2027858 RepID=A0A916ZCZ9_9HYPH|nr:hypothetical protein GCM10011390_02140 [Aureimonas endophytica]